jgi:hypothetical protein
MQDGLAQMFEDAAVKWDADKSPMLQKKTTDSHAGSAFDALLGKAEPKLPHLVALIETEQVAIQKREKDFYGDGESIMPGFHPSFISGTTCRTAYWYSLQEANFFHIDPKLQRIFDNGSDVHSRIQRYLASRLLGTWRCRKCQTTIGQQRAYAHFLRENLSNPAYRDEIEHTDAMSITDKPIPMPTVCPGCDRKQEDEFNNLFVYKEWRIIDPVSGIVGKTDGIILHNNKHVPIEIKSANNRNCLNLLKSGPSLKYRKQFMLYVDRLAAQHPDLEWAGGGIFVYENKDTQQLIEIECWPDTKILEEIYARCTLARTEGRGEAILNDDCAQCNFAQQCVKDGRRER